MQFYPSSLKCVFLNRLLFYVAIVFPSNLLPSQPFGNAVIFPIPIESDPTDSNNCRLIPLIPVISKVFETLISDQLRPFLDREG